MDGLLTKSYTIQQQLGTHKPSDKGTGVARAFANPRVHSVHYYILLNKIINPDEGTETVRDVLCKKFPPSSGYSRTTYSPHRL